MMASPMDGSETLLCAALRGVPGGWRELRDPAAASRFLAAAAQHRLRPLLAWRLHQSPEWTDWPDDIRRGLVNAERAEAALEIVRHQDLSVLLRAFDRAGVPLLLFKGAALAYSRYPRPWLRPREDTDILVRPADRRRAEDLIAAAGYNGSTFAPTPPGAANRSICIGRSPIQRPLRTCWIPERCWTPPTRSRLATVPPRGFLVGFTRWCWRAGTGFRTITTATTCCGFTMCISWLMRSRPRSRRRSGPSCETAAPPQSAPAGWPWRRSGSARASSRTCSWARSRPRLAAPLAPPRT
jgi:hypothetical protein